MGERWVCLVADVDGLRGGGVVESGATNMRDAMVICRDVEEDQKKAEVWTCQEWEGRVTSQGLEASIHVDSQVTRERFPELPNLQERYLVQGEPQVSKGVLCYRGELFRLWGDDQGREVGWEMISEETPGKKAREVVLVDGLSSALPRRTQELGWDCFEKGLRKLAYGHGI